MTDDLGGAHATMAATATAWQRAGFAIVAASGTVSFIHAPGAATDQELRARVNAPDDAVVLVVPGTDPDFSIANWRCHVCGRERLFSQISVADVALAVASAERPAGLKPLFNVSYCNDRDQCTTVATSAPVWPPDEAVAGYCIPTQKLHATPHRGCVLR